MQMLKRQTRVKGAVFIHKDLFAKLFAYAVFLMLNFFVVFVLKETFARLLIGFYKKKKKPSPVKAYNLKDEKKLNKYNFPSMPLKE